METRGGRVLGFILNKRKHHIPGGSIGGSENGEDRREPARRDFWKKRL